MESLTSSWLVAGMVPSHHNLGYHLIVIVIAALAAFIPRYFPMRFFTNRKIPEWFNEWMKYVPISLFTALVIKGIFLSSKYTIFRDQIHLFGQQIAIYGHGSQIVAALLVMVVAYFTRSMAISVLVGLAGVWVIGLLI